MKIRNSFVSNSSSSSFIATIAVVVDEEKLQKFEEKIGEKLDRYNYEEICDRYRYGDFFGLMSKPSETYKDNIFIHVYDDVEIYEDDGYTNYDVDIEDFPEITQDVYGATLEDGLKIIDQTYYAGRNG